MPPIPIRARHAIATTTKNPLSFNTAKLRTGKSENGTDLRWFPRAMLVDRWYPGAATDALNRLRPLRNKIPSGRLSGDNQGVSR
jgi:hypothetical protein